MTRQEINRAESMLKDRVERTEVGGIDGGGLYLTAYFRDGGQKAFYALDALQSWLDEQGREPTGI